MPDVDAGTPGLGPEDAKLITLARAARIRSYTPNDEPAEGAAVRDTDGRTYAAATVGHRSAALGTSALRGALSAFASSGARALEAVVIVSDSDALDGTALALIAEFGPQTPVHVVRPDATVVRSVVAGDALAGA